MVSSNDVTITDGDAGFLRAEGDGVYNIYSPAEVAALRARFAAEAERNAWEDAERFDSDEQARLGARYEERMPEDVKTLLINADEYLADHRNSESWRFILALRNALEAAYSQNGAVDDPR